LRRRILAVHPGLERGRLEPGVVVARPPKDCPEKGRAWRLRLRSRFRDRIPGLALGRTSGISFHVWANGRLAP
jgi:hypothetical protein